MKQLPIPFCTPMVQATLEGRKTRTRRTSGLETVNIIPDSWKQPSELHTVGSKEIIFLFSDNVNIMNLTPFQVTPRYQKGDILWVKETYFDTTNYKSAPLFAEGPDFIYRADKDAFIGEHKWMSTRYMPKKAARIWLEVTGVRCERLKDISESDAIAEGVEETDSVSRLNRWKDYLGDIGWMSPKTSFLSLWDKINGKGSCEANPWVFVYEFKRIPKPCIPYQTI